MRDSFSASVHTESVCFLLSLVRNRESHCLLPENPPPAQGSLWGERGPSSSLAPQPPLPCPRCLWSQASAAPGQAWALPSASTASDRALLLPGLPPALACSSCSPGPFWVPPPPGGLPLAFSPWPLTGEQPDPH